MASGGPFVAPPPPPSPASLLPSLLVVGGAVRGAIFFGVEKEREELERAVVELRRETWDVEEVEEVWKTMGEKADEKRVTTRPLLPPANVPRRRRQRRGGVMRCAAQHQQSKLWLLNG